MIIKKIARIFMGNPAFILASTSPARLLLLEKAGFKPIVCSSNFDESQIQINDPRRDSRTIFPVLRQTSGWRHPY